jgi:hypothetical protein
MINRKKGIKKKCGAKRKYNRKLIAEQLQEFVSAHDIPYIEQFLVENHIGKTALYGWAQENSPAGLAMANAIKECQAKKAWKLNERLVDNRIKPASGIFLLKNCGYSDVFVQQVQEVKPQTIKLGDQEIQF